MARVRAAAASTGHGKSARTASKAVPARRPVRPRKEDLFEDVKIKVMKQTLPFDVLDFDKAFHSSSRDRLEVIKAGVPARKVFDLAGVLKISQDEIIQWLGLSKSTVNRKVKADDKLSADQSERVLGMSKLLGLVQTIVSESGDESAAKGFDAAAWLEDWLSQPNPALGGALPSTYLDTREGQEILSTLISQMQSGAYA